MQWSSAKEYHDTNHLSAQITDQERTVQKYNNLAFDRGAKCSLSSDSHMFKYVKK